MMEDLTDESIFDFGKQHRGKKMANVPASYLLWFHNSVPWKPWTKAIHRYIEEYGIEQLKNEAASE